MKITDVVGPYAITAKSSGAVIASASEAIQGATEKWIASSRSRLAMTLRIVQAHLSLPDKHPHLRDLAARCASFAAREAI
jgi:hypothetical protein